MGVGMSEGGFFAQRKNIIAIVIIGVIVVAAAASVYFFVIKRKPRIYIYYNSGNAARERIATILASEWGKLGFEVVVQAQEWPVYLDTIMDPEAFDVYIIGWAPDYVDPDDYATPMAYGGTQFKSINTYEVSAAADVSNYLSSAKVYEVEDDWYVVVGPKGTGATVDIPSGKKILVVQYEVDEENTIPVANSTPWITIDPAMYRNETGDALIQAGVYDTNPVHRKAIYEAVQQHTNWELPILWLGQFMLVHGQWTWVHGWYFHPVKPVRADLLWEDADAPNVEIGTLGGKKYYNNETVIAEATIGWPESLDGAFTYETFGWEILWLIGDQLVTYWKTETNYPEKDLAIAWAHNEEGTKYYFVIRGGVQAYNPWTSEYSGTSELYNITALDVLFSIWRIASLQGDPSWMITAYIDANSSKVLNETEFDNLLKSTPLETEYKGATKTVHNLSELLDFFGESGATTAGVVELDLTMPYPAILPILADAFVSVVPMKYIFDAAGWDYSQALVDIENGKNLTNLVKYINFTLYENETSHKILHEHPPATGPFYVYDYKEGEYLILKKNPYYWNSTLYSGTNYGTIDYVIYVIYDETSPRLELYKKGAVDFCYVPAENIPDVNGTTYEGTNYKIVITKDPNLLTYDIVFVVWNCMKSPFNNLLARRAFAYATPYETIYSQVYNNLTVPLYGVIPKGMLGYTEKNIIKYEYNITKAKELIEASGVLKSSFAIIPFLPFPIFVLPVVVVRDEE